MYFRLRLGIFMKILTLMLRSFLEYSYFCYYYGQILLFFSTILQFQPQGIPRIFLIFYEISAWYSCKHYCYEKIEYDISIKVFTTKVINFEFYFESTLVEKISPTDACLHVILCSQMPIWYFFETLILHFFIRTSYFWLRLSCSYFWTRFWPFYNLDPS